MKRYITVLSTDNYLIGVLVLNMCLKLINSKYPLVVAINKSITKETKNILTKNGIEYKVIKKVVAPTSPNYSLYSHWANTFDKIAIFNLSEYEKLVYVDSDMMVLQNLDELFDKPNMSAVRAGMLMHPDWIGLNSGLMVVEPNKKDYKGMLEAIKNYKDEKEIGDQDIISIYFKNWVNQDELHLPEEYNVFYCWSETYLHDPYNLKREDYNIIHFIGKNKPWNIEKEEVEVFKAHCILNQNTKDYLIEYLSLIEVVKEEMLNG